MPPKRIVRVRNRCSVHRLFLSKEGKCKRCVEESKKDVVEVEGNESSDNNKKNHSPQATHSPSQSRQPRYTLRNTRRRGPAHPCTSCDGDIEEPVVSVTSEDDSEDAPRRRSKEMCMNCHRLVDEVISTSSEEVHFSKGACSMKKVNHDVNLCYECKRCLSVRRTDWQWAWPGIMWKMFCNADNQPKAQAMWRFLSLELRLQWISSYRGISQDHKNVSFRSPAPHFKDVTVEVSQLNQIKRGRYRLGDLMEWYNRYCYCAVKCPWGCDAFIEETGKIPFDVVLRDLLHAKVQVVSSTSSKYLNRRNVLGSMRRDYLTRQHNFLKRPSWPIRPSVQVMEGFGLVLLTCPEHDGGTILKYVHPPLNPATQNMPAARSDQLAHAVVAPRSLKTIKSNRFSDTYQVVNCKGGYAGLDTCNVVESGKFDFVSWIAERNEDLYISQRPDMKSRLDVLVRDGKIPRWLRDDKLQADTDWDSGDYNELLDDALSGSTTVRLNDIIEMSSAMNETDYAVNKVIDEDSGREKVINFRPPWPKSILFCHPCDPRGDKFPDIVHMRKDCDARLLWLMVSMTVSQPLLWKSIVSQVEDETEWPGWLLYFCTKYTLPFPFPCGRDDGNPYSGKVNVESVMQLLDSTYEDEPYESSKLIPLLSLLPHTALHFGQLDLSEEVGFTAVDTDMFFLIGEIDEEENILPMTFDQTDNEGRTFTYEQVYKAWTENDTSDWSDLKRWKACAYVRHLKCSYDKCWRMERTKATCKSEFPRGGVWDVVMFVKVNTDADSYRKRYLQYMGCETKLVCPKHKFPLTVTPSHCDIECKMSCDGEECVRAAAVECPLSSCSMALCKKHVGSEEELHLQRLMECESRLSKVDTEAENDVGECTEEVMSDTNSDISECIDDESDLSAAREEGDTSLLIDDGVSGSSSIEENKEEASHYSVEHRDGESDNEEEVVSLESNEEALVPFTIAQTAVPANVKTNFSSRYEVVGLHVIMNKIGSLLQRKGGQLILSKGEEGFFQRIMATSSCSSVPLAYAEGMMYPSIFWKQDSDGSIPGAIPSCLLRRDKECWKYGFAGVRQQLLCRITNSELQCGTNPRYMFQAFDIMNNVMANGQDNRIILRRGFEHMIGPNGIKSMSDRTLMNQDLVESRSQVNKLSAALCEYGESGDTLCPRGPYAHCFGRTLFFTHTCNQEKHPGVAPIRIWLKSILESIDKHNFDNFQHAEELKKAMRQVAAVQIIRSWRRVGRALIDYMVHSREYRYHPSGHKFLLHWYRFEEGQMSPGALPHIHAIFFLQEDRSNPENVSKTESTIRCSVRDIIDPIEASRYVKEGLLGEVDDMLDVQDDARRQQRHHCRRPRCIRMSGDGNEKSTCRNPDYAKINPHPSTYGLVKFTPNHSPRALELFEKMNLAKLDSATGKVIDIDEKLQFGKVVYPAVHGEHFVPCLARIFAATRSTNNAQICTYYMNSRYLANYTAGVDENHQFFVKGGKEENEYNLVHDEVPNTKIASNRIYANKQMKNRQRRNAIKGRPLGLPEAISNMLGLPQVYTDINFVMVPTVPLEERPAFDMQRRKTETRDASDGYGNSKVEDPEAIRVRKMLNLPRNRQFKESEVMTIKDASDSPLSVDKITAYGCRPPELRFVDSPTEYYRCFSRQPYQRPIKVESEDGEDVYISTQERLLKKNIFRCGWVDGLDCQVLVRPCAIRRVLALPKCFGPIRRLFVWLMKVNDEDEGYCSDGCPYYDGPIDNYISSDDDDDLVNQPSRVHTVANERQHYHDKAEGKARVKRNVAVGNFGQAFRIARSVSLGVESERSLSSVESIQPGWIVDDDEYCNMHSVGSSGLVDTISIGPQDMESLSYDVLSDSHPSMAIDPNLEEAVGNAPRREIEVMSIDDSKSKLERSKPHCSTSSPPECIYCVTQDTEIVGSPKSRRENVFGSIDALEGGVSASDGSDVCERVNRYESEESISLLYSDVISDGGVQCDVESGEEGIVNCQYSVLPDGTKSHSSVSVYSMDSMCGDDAQKVDDRGTSFRCEFESESASCDGGSTLGTESSSGSSVSTATTVRAIFEEQDKRMSFLRGLFIDKSYTSPFTPVVIYNCVRPTKANRFITHMLLSMGRFDNEMELFKGSTIRDYFKNAKLLRGDIDIFPPSEDDITIILKEYIMKQLLFIPGGTKTLNRLILAAYDALHSAIMGNEIVSNDMPPYFYSTLRLQANEKAKHYESCIRYDLANALCNSLPDLPNVDRLISATKVNPLSWRPELGRLELQAEMSYEESKAACEEAVNVVDDYVCGRRKCTKNFIIIGPPGTGKTFQMLLAVAYAMSKGLTVCVTALQGDRANSIGGRHMHVLFGMPKMATLNVQTMVEATICNLQRQPEKICFIRQVDVIGIDELTLPSAEHMACLDMVFRYYRNATSYFGGVLLLCSMDHCQMPPVAGMPSLMSPHILTSFDILKLEHPIRSRRDRNLMRLIELTRQRDISVTDDEEIMHIIINECTHFPNWQDGRITSDMVRVFGKRIAAAKAEKMFFDSVRRKSIKLISRKAEDIQCASGSHGAWQNATVATSHGLDSEVNEVETLHLYRGMLVEMTYNNNREHWAQSQMGIVLELPSQEELDDFKAIEIMLAPPSVRSLPNGDGDVTKSRLLQRGWRAIKVGPVPEREPVYIGRGILAKRKQYGMRPRISCTIHKIMGTEVEKLITQISDAKDDMYGIWQREQVQVLISRTFLLRNLVFVGDPVETARAICRIVHKRGQFAEYIEHVIEQKTSLHSLCGSSEEAPIVHQSLHPFRPCDVELPDDLTGFVYVLVSLKDNYTTYIGKANNLLRKVKNHNKGYGTTDGLDLDLRPWHVICFVTGFNGDKREMQVLRDEWEGTKMMYKKDVMPPKKVISLGNEIVTKNNRLAAQQGTGIKLQMVVTVEFEDVEVSS